MKTMYEVKLYTNDGVTIIGKYTNYFEAFNEMLRISEHFAKCLKSKCHKVFTYTWMDNILIREEYDMGINNLEEDYYGKFELVERREWA